MSRYGVLCLVLVLAAGCVEKPRLDTKLASKPCASLARVRMQDARANGYEDRLQRVVFEGTYADCVAWEAKGYEPQIP